MSNLLKSKRFVLRQSLIGKETNIEVTFKTGKKVTYSHDRAFEIMKSSLESMNCWSKYKSYTASGNLPKVVRETEAVIEVLDHLVEESGDNYMQ
jgi:hypothetical protein|tara:strand:- start:242 stop:523 length:282 start_codon:yes stop_codon:yes gene_type:complete